MLLKDEHGLNHLLDPSKLGQREDNPGDKEGDDNPAKTEEQDQKVLTEESSPKVLLCSRIV